MDVDLVNSWQMPKEILTPEKIQTGIQDVSQVAARFRQLVITFQQIWSKKMTGEWIKTIEGAKRIALSFQR
jgi:hypothetical protein